MKIRFYTSTPLNVFEGSGTFTATSTLVDSLRDAGAKVEVIGPKVRLPVYTAERLLFNRWIATLPRNGCDVTVGIDLDGYLIAGTPGPPHVAAIKGVIGDERLHERGMTRFLMGIQARRERRHVHNADLVTTTSAYSAGRIVALYGQCSPVEILAEPINLSRWRVLFRANPAAPDPKRFTVLCVCRFYPRKRVRVLLEAAALVRREVSSFQLRIVGAGPERDRLRELARELALGDTVQWLGDVDQSQLAAEYQRCDVFCLPSVQEGFGLVFMEAMAAAKPIVTVRAGAVGEVAPQALFAEPDNPKSLAQQLTILYADPIRRASAAQEGHRRVRQFDAPVVATEFLGMLERLLNSRRA